MAISEAKILESERNAVYVKSNQGSRLTGTVEQNKNAFDKFPQLNMDKHNSLVEILSALNLDTIVDDLSDRYTKELTEKRLSEETNSLIESITFDSTDGSFKITTKDGNVKTIDTDLEKIPAKLTLETEGDVTYLVITNQDGSTTKTDVTKLLNVYTFTDGSTITFTENPQYKVTAEVTKNSITTEHFTSDTLSYLQGLEESAKNSATAAAGSATNSEASAVNSSSFMTQSQSYAIGGTGTRTGEDTDNAKYYSEQSNKDYTALEADLEKQREEWPIEKGLMTSDTIYIERIASYDSKTRKTTQLGIKTHIKPKAVTTNHISDDFVTDLLNSTEFSGTPTAPTPDTGDSSTRLATTEFVDKYHDSLDLGDFVDADLAEHMADVNAHSGIIIDAMSTAATTQDTLDTHKSAEDSHGNLTVDGGDLRDPKKYRNQETLEEHETASYAHSNLVIEGGTV